MTSQNEVKRPVCPFKGDITLLILSMLSKYSTVSSLGMCYTDVSWGDILGFCSITSAVATVLQSS